MSERKLKAWQDAGLIDAATGERIRAWEAQHSKPLGLWALIGLGALAIGLGLVSVVAANWDAISGTVRLTIHFVLLVALAGFMFWQARSRPLANGYFHDALIFILATLGLTFFGHIGQVYQTSAPLWQPLALWLLLFTPLLLCFGRGWLAAALWIGGLCFTAFEHWQWYADFSILRGSNASPQILYMGAISSLPTFVMAFAAFMRSRSTRPDFWKRLEQIGLTLIVWGVSGFQLFYALDRSSNLESAKIAAVQAVILGGAAAIVWMARRTRSGQATAVILAAGAVTLLAAQILSGSLGGGILFMLFWGVIAGAALYASWRAVFQVAVTVLAIRLIILSFELASDLLGRGLGLILAGVATLAIAFLAVRISKRYAPKEGAA